MFVEQLYVLCVSLDNSIPLSFFTFDSTDLLKMNSFQRVYSVSVLHEVDRYKINVLYWDEKTGLQKVVTPHRDHSLWNLLYISLERQIRGANGTLFFVCWLHVCWDSVFLFSFAVLSCITFNWAIESPAFHCPVQKFDITNLPKIYCVFAQAFLKID